MLALYQSDGIIAEPAGAMASAALAQLDLEPGSRVGCIVSGGNNDVSRYADVIERSLVHEGLRHYFLVGFPQEPGPCAASSTTSSPTARTSWSSSTSRSPTGRPAPR